jgi:hypothetical protein
MRGDHRAERHPPHQRRPLRDHQVPGRLTCACVFSSTSEYPGAVDTRLRVGSTCGRRAIGSAPRPRRPHRRALRRPRRTTRAARRRSHATPGARSTDPGQIPRRLLVCHGAWCSLELQAELLLTPSRPRTHQSEAATRRADGRALKRISVLRGPPAHAVVAVSLVRAAAARRSRQRSGMVHSPDGGPATWSEDPRGNHERATTSGGGLRIRRGGLRIRRGGRRSR